MTVHLKPLSQQVIVITGASSGIGLATARLAASRGARLVLAARSAGALKTLVDEIRTGPGEDIGPPKGGPYVGDAIAVTADVTRQADVEHIAAEAVRVFGGFDTWINNAAVSAYGACLEVDIEDMRQIIETNFWGTVYGSRVGCAYLRHGGGALINVGSIVSDVAVPLQGIYSASKHAIKGWTDALRVELAYEQAPISVTLIKPAAIDTPYAEHAMNYLADQPTHAPPVYTPAAVAEAVLYAAEHPIRELYVGGGGRVLSAVGALAPRLTDMLMTRFLLPSTHSGRPRDGRAILYAPSEDLRERGDYQGLVRDSVYTWLVTHRAAAGLVAAGAALLLASWRTRRQAHSYLQLSRKWRTEHAP